MANPAGWLRSIFGPAPEPRPTLTFLPDGGIVIGAPRDLASDQVQHLVAMAERLRDAHGVIVLPWPVDVVDLRR